MEATQFTVTLNYTVMFLIIMLELNCELGLIQYAFLF